ncbi:bacillithiol system redox-active protein YtxJ [Christiangramia sediminis]|uniref:Bacillithiol system redox-active protein YtxJ n=1 Tax=Christiangramia sediminis TaxID=2881336 RepID=A0A9X1RX64_9FLAO|nr:bacillithiol system redox-active protein YtxJ [Christiangramia sediminis]MCB7480832.1 bacillithiol system redox-active protein YtxJ [Christiangramia sediminis]
MGLFDKIFNSEKKENSEEKSATPWIELNSMAQLDEMEERSEERTVAILKHSTTCGISRMVLKMFESDYDLDENEAIDLYFLDLRAHRDISNAIAEKFRVRHESPQLIVLKNREVVHHSSHQGISASKLKELV